MSGFIKLYRDIKEWEWWHDINTHRLFSYMLIEAWWKDGNYKGEVISRGSFPSSISKLSHETDLTINEVRTALNHLKSTGEITSKKCGKFTVFTVNNFDLYQDDNKAINEETTSNFASNDADISQEGHKESTRSPQTINKQLTSSYNNIYNNINTKEKERKNIKEGKNERSKEDIYSGVRERIVEYLNQKCGTRYRPDTGETKKFINGRLSEGYTEDDFYTVIDKKAEEWTGTEWEKYLKPNTLFRPANFESYVNQKIVKGNSTGNAYIDSIRDRVSAVDSW